MTDETQPNPTLQPASPDGTLEIQGLGAAPEKPGPDVEFINHTDGRLEIRYPNGRPGSISMSTTMLEAVTDDLNAWRELVGLLEMQISTQALGYRFNPEARVRIAALRKRFGLGE